MYFLNVFCAYIQYLLSAFQGHSEAPGELYGRSKEKKKKKDKDDDDSDEEKEKKAARKMAPRDTNAEGDGDTDFPRFFVQTWTFVAIPSFSIHLLV